MGRTADEGNMRCLYCGNELALLKKLTGHGEFCSEAHRQKYQEQYNRLALTRLLQAQDAKPERPPLSRTSVRPANTLPSGRPRPELESAEARRPDAPNAPPPAPEPAAPAMASFLPHGFEPAQTPGEPFSNEPIAGSVAACLPASQSSEIVRPASTSGAECCPQIPAEPNLGIVGPAPFQLVLARGSAQPIANDGAESFPFTPEYQHTLSDRLTLCEAAVVKPAPLVRKRPAPLVKTHPVHPPVVINFAALGEIDPALAEPAAKVEEVPAPVEAVPPEAPAIHEIVPPLCTRPSVVRLDVVSTPLAPMNDTAFEAPVFAVQTPPVASHPLRAKVVFGPRPLARETLSGALPVEAEPEPAPVAQDTAEAVPMPATEPAPAPAVVEPAQDAGMKRQPSLVVPETHAAPAVSSDLEALRLEIERQSGADYEVPRRSKRILVVVGLVLVLFIVGWLLQKSRAATTGAVRQNPSVEAFGPVLMTGQAALTPDQAEPDSSVYGRQVYVFKPSKTLSDYRFEFESRIQAGGVGWVFRCVNPRNYYIEKLDVIGGETAPRLMLTRAAVINGEETQRSVSEVAVPFRPGEVYRIRTDVLGATFKTYVQDKLADTWIDDRLKAGGVGLLKDRPEAAQVSRLELRALRVAN